jgi:hypothetical protein
VNICRGGGMHNNKIINNDIYNSSKDKQKGRVNKHSGQERKQDSDNFNKKPNLSNDKFKNNSKNK